MNGINSHLPVGDSFTNGMFAARSSRAGDTPAPESNASVGEEFESVFLSMLLKNMRSTVSDDGMFAGDGSDTYGGMFDLFMSQHLASNDSLGIGNLIEGLLNKQPTTSQQR